ncbi:MAG TPA: hypothetical protein VKS25_09300 [Solirubrobacteraceae bacterium]|nr:hypothetical protein [Solirubrobacteraceae bacterium]
MRTGGGLFGRRTKPTPERSVVVAGPAGPLETSPSELVLVIMRAAPDLRYSAARELGLLEGLAGGQGPELERRILERARDEGKLEALAQAIPT